MSKKEHSKKRFDQEDLLDIQSASSTEIGGPLVDDSDDEFEDDDSGALWSSLPKAGSLFLTVLRVPIRGAVWSGALLWKVGRGLGGFCKRIGSLFIFRDDESEADEESDEPDEAPRAVESAPAVRSTDQPIASAATEDRFEEEDESGRFFNLGFGMKLAGLAAVCLLAVGGYFGVKSFFSKNDPATAQAVVDVPEEKDAVAVVAPAPAPAPAKPEEKKTANASDPKPVPPKKPEEKKGEKTVAAKPAPTPPQKPGEKKDEKAAVANPAPTPPQKTEGKKNEKAVVAKPAPAPSQKTEEKKDEKTVAAKPASAPTQKTEEKKDEKAVAAKPAPAPPQKPEGKKDEKAAASKIADNNQAVPFHISAPVPSAPAPVSAPAPAVETASSPFWATPSPNASAPAPTAGAFDWASPAPAPVASSPTPEPAPMTPLAGPIDPAPSTTPPTTKSNDSPPLNNPSPSKESTPTATAGLIPLQPLTASANSVPPASPTSGSAPNDIPKERAIGIPESGLAKFAAEEFSRVPETPKVETPVSTLQLDEPIRPLAPVASIPDTVPGIPSSNAVEPLARTATSSNLRPMQPVHSGESAPAIPGDSAPASSVAFSAPAVRGNESTPTSPTSTSSPARTVAEAPSYVPPIPADQPVQPIQPMQPIGQPATKSAPTVAAAPAMQPLSGTPNAGTTGSGDRIGIPGDTLSSTVAATTSRTAVPTQPEHVQLAQTDPPLGSQLQHQIQELRAQETVAPKLKFERKDTGSTGAVRFNPPAASAPLPMPSGDQPNALAALNPTGTTDPSVAATLPSASEAPPAIFAESFPPYNSSVSNQRIPAQASVGSTTTASTGTSNRAQLFRQKLNEEIKRSPSTAESYVVQDGDTYMTICDRFFGTSLLYRALAEHNRRRGAAYIPAVGTKIEIPTADYLKTEYAEILSRGGRLRGNRSPSGTTPQRGAQYRVQDGDSVFRIATNQLRDSSRWREIIELNSDQLRSAKDLQPGMDIYLPAENTAASSMPTVFGRR